MNTDAHVWWMQMQAYVFGRRSWGGGEVPAVQADGWGRRPPPPPSRLAWPEYCLCYLVIILSVYGLDLEFRGFLLDDDYSVVNVLALILARIMHMLVMFKSSSPAPSSWTALALLPTCPAPALDTPPVCYEWEKPAAAAAMVLPGSSGSADSNWRSDEQYGDYNASKKCFDSLVRDAAWTCDEQEDDHKAAMKCFDSLVRDAARICFVWSCDDAIHLTRQSDDDPPPT